MSIRQEWRLVYDVVYLSLFMEKFGFCREFLVISRN